MLVIFFLQYLPVESLPYVVSEILAKLSTESHDD